MEEERNIQPEKSEEIPDDGASPAEPGAKRPSPESGYYYDDTTGYEVYDPTKDDDDED